MGTRETQELGRFSQEIEQPIVADLSPGHGRGALHQESTSTERSFGQSTQVLQRVAALRSCATRTASRE